MTERPRAEELHDEYRKKVWDDIKSGTENFDRYMLTFSSGALGLSLAFIKDAAPLGKAVWVPWLFSSWIAFVLCILVTLLSFRISIRALEEMVPHLDAFYLEGKADSFNKHVQSRWFKAVDWCAYVAIILFVLGLIFTMMFVGANIREAKRVSKQETTPKGLPISDLQKGIKPVPMTATDALKPAAMAPLSEGLKPPATTPVASAAENRGLKPAGMTPIPAQSPTPSVPASGTDTMPAQPI